MGGGRGGKGGAHRGSGSGQGGRGRGGGGGYGRKEREDEQHQWQDDRRRSGGGKYDQDHRHPAVKFGDYFISKDVRPFPGADGSSFIKRRGSKNDTESLSVKKIGGSMTLLSSEWFNGRLAHAGSFLGANFEEAAKMFSLLGSSAQGPGAMKTGLGTLSAALTGPGSGEVTGAAKLLNTSNEDLDRRPQDVQQAAIALFRFLREHERPIQKLACLSAKLLAFSLSGLEALAALSSRDQWSDALHEQADLHNAAVKSFIREPRSDKHLVKAIAACYQDFVTERERSGKGAGGLFDDDWEESKSTRPRSMDESDRKKSAKFDQALHSDDDLASQDGGEVSDTADLFGSTERKKEAGGLFDKPRPRGEGARMADRRGAEPHGGSAAKRAGVEERRAAPAAVKSFALPSESDAGGDPAEESDLQEAIDAAIVDWGSDHLRAAHRASQKPRA